MSHLLSMLELLGSGITAGVFFAVALGMIPAFAAMPPDRYVYTYLLMGRNWDPTMPIIVLSSALLDVTLSVLTSDATARALTIAAAVSLVGASVVSHFCNVPINKNVRKLTPDTIPPGWQDPRPLWRRWHMLRTALALLALALNGLAASLAH